MAGPWITDAELKIFYSDMLQKVDSASLVVTDGQMTLANQWAANEITTILAARGYGSYLDVWDRRKEFNVKLGLYWLCTLAGVPHATVDIFINKLDPRQELKDLAVVMVNGEIVSPVIDANSMAGSIGWGNIATDIERLKW